MLSYRIAKWLDKCHAKSVHNCRQKVEYDISDLTPSEKIMLIEWIEATFINVKRLKNRINPDKHSGITINVIQDIVYTSWHKPDVFTTNAANMMIDQSIIEQSLANNTLSLELLQEIHHKGYYCDKSGDFSHLTSLMSTIMLDIGFYYGH